MYHIALLRSGLMCLTLYLAVCVLVSVALAKSHKVIGARAGGDGGSMRCGNSGRGACKSRPRCPLGIEGISLNEEPSSELPEYPTKLPEPPDELPELPDERPEPSDEGPTQPNKRPELPNESPDSAENPIYNGTHMPRCVRSYHKKLESGQAPQRNYSYWHEVQKQHKEKSEEKECDIIENRNLGIVGGDQVCINEVPYTVLYGMICGGSLISPEWVLTAAHCFEKETFVIAGSTLRHKGWRYSICAHFTHPLWSIKNKTHKSDYDYQLVLLEQSVPVTRFSIPVAIGTAADTTPGTMVAVSGWGVMMKVSNPLADAVRRIFVPIIDFEECRHYLPHLTYQNITPRMICMGYKEGKKDSCKGDSGGPAVANGKLIGVVSFGKECAKPNQPGVYANVPAVREWIRSITALVL